jgi:hypothetical protein
VGWGGEGSQGGEPGTALSPSPKCPEQSVSFWPHVSQVWFLLLTPILRSSTPSGCGILSGICGGRPGAEGWWWRGQDGEAREELLLKRLSVHS